MFVNQVCSVVAIVGKNQDIPFLGEVFGATLRERDILLSESPKLYDERAYRSRRTTQRRSGFQSCSPVRIQASLSTRE